MANDKNKDFLFGRLENEMKQIEEQKKRNAQRVKESQKNWLAQLFLELGQALGKIVSGTFEFLSEIIDKIFNPRK